MSPLSRCSIFKKYVSLVIMMIIFLVLHVLQTLHLPFFTYIENSSTQRKENETSVCTGRQQLRRLYSTK